MVISASDADRLVKSSERVQDLGEVLTPPETVQSMLDMLPTNLWNEHPSGLFFEPGCGNGNFLVEILKRKLHRIAKAFNKGTLAAGADREALQFHSLEALASIYGIDICPENIVGEKEGNNLGARRRLIAILADWYESVTGEALEETSSYFTSAMWILERNILVADMLKIGQRSARGLADVPLVDYEWHPNTGLVEVRKTSVTETLKDVDEESTGLLSLRLDGDNPPWSVHPLELADVPIESPRVPRRRPRNGNGWRAR